MRRPVYHAEVAAAYARLLGELSSRPYSRENDELQSATLKAMRAMDELVAVVGYPPTSAVSTLEIEVPDELPGTDWIA